MKIKVIDILNKIANNEEPPKKIMYKEQEYEYDENEKDYYYCDFSIYKLFDDRLITKILNDEVEILQITITYNQDKEMCHKCHKYPAEYNQTECEFCLGITPKEIEKIDLKEINKNLTYGVKNDVYLAIKINEIIDRLNNE